MKKYLSGLAAVLCGLLLVPACQPVSNEMDPDYPSDYDINYSLKTVTEKDPVNINGIDVYPYFDFFKTFSLTIHVRDGKMATLEVDNGDVPFSPFSFDMPEGEVECYYDSQSSPNVLRLSGSDEPVAYFKSGELYIPFKLDCKDIDYEYRFKEVVE